MTATETLVETGPVRVTRDTPAARFSLRARGDVAALGSALGGTLPDRIGARSTGDGWEALRLGPDEWVIVATAEAGQGLPDRLSDVDQPHALVDISCREVTFVLDGPGAEELLTLGCPRDLRGLPEGEGRRTVFDGASAVLWRDGADRFRLDCWRSFSPHVAALLVTGAREIAAGVV